VGSGQQLAKSRLRRSAAIRQRCSDTLLIMKLQIWVFAIGLTLSASPSWSADRGLSADYARCEERAKGETPALMDCLDAEFRRQDARLNVAYKALLVAMSPKKAEELRKVQRA
jgi:uncharacterized protein YecT (DUF1311 family)